MRLQYKDYFITIGLEIHVALNTKKKLFSETENSFKCQTFSLLDCATPGVLPTLQTEAVTLACLFGFATKSKINQYSEFERKHYFYPDLSLGYQITQQHKPILGTGFIPIEINGESKLIEIEHAHLECDAAKSLHDMYREYTAIDISRGGTALLEIVSTPCMHSPQEAKEYAKTIHSLVKVIGICDGKMEEGSFRVDASISLSKDETTLGTRVEIKNISSFSFLETALEYEIERQSELLDSGGKVLMQTRLFNEETKSTLSMRDKETVQDYRFLQDPDIPALNLTDKFLAEIKSSYFFDFFGLIEFYKNKINKEKLDIKTDKIIDIFGSKVSSYLFDFYNKKYLIDGISTSKLLKSLFFWTPEIISKSQIEDLALPTTESFVSILKSPLEAKEFKDLFVKWLEDTSIDILTLMPKESPEDEKLIKETLESIFIYFKNQLDDPKLTLDKKIQFVMGQSMKRLKGKITASKLSEEIKQKFNCSKI